MANSVTRQLLIAEATRRGWQVSFVGHNAFFCKITNQAGQSELFRGSRPLRSSANGSALCKYKDLTMQYVQACGYHVPAYTTVDQYNNTAEEFLKAHGPIVAKPVDSQQSVAITTGIKTARQLETAIKLAIANSSSGRAILQKQLSGKLYRLFVIDGKISQRLIVRRHKLEVMVSTQFGS